MRATLGAALLAAILAVVPATTPAGAQEDGPAAADTDVVAAADTCQALAGRLDEHARKVNRELRLIKREIAALRQAQEEPGVREVMAGIGYILGLAGVGFYFAGRRNQHRYTDRLEG